MRNGIGLGEPDEYSRRNPHVNAEANGLSDQDMGFINLIFYRRAVLGVRCEGDPSQEYQCEIAWIVDSG